MTTVPGIQFSVPLLKDAQAWKKPLKWHPCSSQTVSSTHPPCHLYLICEAICRRLLIEQPQAAVRISTSSPSGSTAASFAESGSHSGGSPSEIQTVWRHLHLPVSLLFLYAWGAKLLRNVCHNAYVCVKRMWRRTQGGLLIINMIQSLIGASRQHLLPVKQTF